MLRRHLSSCTDLSIILVLEEMLLEVLFAALFVELFDIHASFGMPLTLFDSDRSSIFA